MRVTRVVAFRRSFKEGQDAVAARLERSKSRDRNDSMCAHLHGRVLDDFSGTNEYHTNQNIPW